MVEDGSVRFKGRWCIPNVPELKEKILEEAHSTYIKVKSEHKRPQGMIEPSEVPAWKWDSISMDFVCELLRTPKGNNMIWVILDRLTKSAHFVPMKYTWNHERLTSTYIEHVFKLHGIPSDIVSDRDPKFLPNFWQKFQEALGTKLKMSTTFHPATDALYGWRCRTRLCWSDIGEYVVIDPKMIKETIEQVELIQQKMKAVQDRQKSYGDKHRRHEEFQVGEKPKSLQLDDNMTYEEFPVQILDHKVRKTRKGEIKIVKEEIAYKLPCQPWPILGKAQNVWEPASG
ncbi:uncharacterized protein LOC109133807 [Beta vulgaris subsp. vulgaris]|uniref:uncharacterized protein LOC109133807 n=1 Tax=Beta vulgaris subsp. vulgaris TaxID=3555 RepID=UPI0025489D15|nr:uncharacterized protein LOC109133807 [Beta vulgaris subsp. vulgaris]